MSIILVSESIYGGHIKEETIKSFSMSYVVNVAKKDGKYIPANDLSNNQTFQEIVKAYNSDKESIIFIGFDYDLMGQAMADTLEHNLSKYGITSFARTPYFDDEYITIAEPMDLQTYYEYLYLNQQFFKEHKRQSLKKVLCLEALNNYREKEFALDNENGNSTITYITKTLLKECV